MDEERQRVLRMLKSGRITVEEAEALLDALGEEHPGLAADAAPEAEAPPRDDLKGLIEEIIASIDIDGIVNTVRESADTVRESLQRSRMDVRRARGEVRRAVREARRHGIRFRIAEAIEGLWGMAGASGAWAHDASLAPGQRLCIHNLWGDTRITASADGQMHARASIRAWGHDEAAAAIARDRVRIVAGPEGNEFVIRVSPSEGAVPRRVRVDFDIALPPQTPASVAQVKGDLLVRGVAGDLDLRTLRGDIEVEAAGGRVSANSKRGDLALRRPVGPLTLDLSTVRGDAEVEVDQFLAGTASRVATVRGDLTVRLGPRAGCRVSAHVASGEIHAHGGLGQVQRGGRSLLGVHASGEANLDLSTVSGDILISTTSYSP